MCCADNGLSGARFLVSDYFIKIIPPPFSFSTTFDKDVKHIFGYESFE
jgi:hypothetical protein